MEESFEETENHDDLILSDGWKIILIENDRLFYVHETDKLCCWIPSERCWESRRGLPYGLEMARSRDGRRYYINHLAKDTVRSLSSIDHTSEASLLPPRTRTVLILRHSDTGFGFVAGSEKPVLIRSVAEDGPSSGKLYANDQILKINGEDVRDLPQSEVILRIKQYSQELSLEVISNDDVQDAKNQGLKKSSIMSRATRERRRSNPVSVRFAETPVLVPYGGSPPSIPLRRSSLPLIPNALKIFLENGQTRSFLYTPETTVKELFVSLGEKIGLKTLDRFSFVLQSSQGLGDSYVLFNEPAAQIYTRRNCSSSTWLCKLLLVFAPKDINHLLKEDPIAFEYFYKQMCSTIVDGRWEIKYETAIKLAALQLQQYALEDKVGKTAKISVKAIEKEVGSLETFVPSALINTMQKKDLQRILAQQIKQTRNLCPPGHKYISPVQAKLQYLKICSDMKMYGARQFNAIIVDAAEDQKLFPDQKLTSVIFVGPNVGLSKVTNPRSFTMDLIADFNQINGLVVTPHTEGKQNLKIFLTNGKSVTLILGPYFETRDLVYLISGYCKYLVENANPLSIIDMTTTGNIPEATSEVPSYLNRHRVVPDTWSYKDDNNEDLKDVDLRHQPKFEGSEMYSEINGNIYPEGAVKHEGCNGIIKTTPERPDSGAVNDSPNLERIQEEPSSPGKDDATISSLFPDHVDGITRKSLVNLPDDLKSESNDEDTENPITTEVPQIINGESSGVTPNHIKTTTSTTIEVPVVIVDESPVHTTKLEDDAKETSHEASPIKLSLDKHAIDINESSDDEISSYKISLDISLTSSAESSLNNSGDEASMLSSHSEKYSPVLVEDDDPLIITNTNGIAEESPRNQSIEDGGDNHINKDHKQPVEQSVALKRNGDLKTQHSIHKNRPSLYKTAKSWDEHEENITSRSQACDHALKNLYVQKAKLNSILHWNHPVRTNNEIVGTKRHFMIDRVTVLDECIKQLQLLTATEENRIIDLILRLPYAFGLLTESCTMLYNAQYSMRHCSQALIDTIDKFIDVLITTDAWDPENISDLNVEIHKDKCESVHYTLESLRKIISSL